MTDKAKTTAPNPRCISKTTAHPCHENPVGYIAWHEKARRLGRKKVRQEKCPICDRFKFPDEQCAEFMALKAMQNV